MSRVPSHFTAILVTLMILGGFLGPDEPIGLLTCDGGCLPDFTDTYVLDSNNTTNITADLRVLHPPPFYEGEVNTVIMDVFGGTEEYPTNISHSMLGLDRLGPPECTEYYDLNDTIYPRRDDHIWHFIGALSITYSNESRMLLGRVIAGNTTLNLSYEFAVQPPRVHLNAEIGLPLEDLDWYEQTWVTVPVIIENHGGAPGTNLVMDFSYDGRIAATESINLVPSHGNVTVTIPLFIVKDGWDLEVDLVQGPGAPLNIAELPISFWERPILDVVEIRADPTSIESGSRVHLEAVVTNRGNATSDGQLVELMVDGTVVANESIVGLEPGDSRVVSTNWTLTGVGIHTVSVIAEGDEFAAEPVAVEVSERTPGSWSPLAVLSLLSSLLVTGVARRSRSAGRA